MRNSWTRWDWVAVILATLLAGSAVGQERVPYELDNVHSSLVFSVSHAGLSYTYGRFNELAGEFSWDPADPAQGVFQLDVDAASIDTNSGERDQHLRSEDFFHVDKFPQITLRSTAIEQTTDGEWVLKGELTLRGTTRPVEMPLTVVGIGKGPFGKERAGFFTRFVIKRSEFGMDKMLDVVGDNISITFSFEGIRKEADQ